MQIFRTLWQAVERLAASFNALAATVESFNDEVRQRCGLSADPQLPESSGEEADTLPSTKRRRLPS